jgi:sarcosine oxidase
LTRVAANAYDLTPMERYDTIVVGLGGMGSAAAYHIARRGKRVVGLEQFTLAHDRGSSHGRSRITRQAYFENPAYVPLLGRANELFAQLQRESGMRLMEITGGLMLGPPDGGVVKGTLASARAHGLPHEVLEAAEVRKRFPQFSVDDGKIGVLDKVAGALFPEDCIRAHAAAATQAGAQLRWQEPLVSWKATGDSVEVKTAQGTYVAGNLVLCAGSWMGDLLADLKVPLSVERNVLYWFRPTTDIANFTPDKFPVFIIEYEPGKVFYGFPALADDGVKVARHHTGVACTPTDIQREVNQDEIREARGILERNLPTVNGELLSATTCMYTNTPDGHFIIDRHPAHPNVIVASPCSGHGFKFTAVVGEVLADLACDGQTKHPIDFFRLRRFTLTSSPN